MKNEHFTIFFLVFFPLYLFEPCPIELGFILFEDIVDPDQLASDEANLSGSTLFYTLIDMLSLSS